jgi:hypothetical protein
MLFVLVDSSATLHVRYQFQTRRSLMLGHILNFLFNADISLPLILILLNTWQMAMLMQIMSIPLVMDHHLINSA